MTAACPYCRAPFEPEDEVKVCDACATPHHADCYAENGGCTVFGCANAPVDEPKISISASDVRGTPPPIAAAPPPQAAPPPPPPRSTSAVPPPPRPFAFQGFAPGTAPSYAPPQPRPISFGGYNPPELGPVSPYIRRRSRLTFILLGVLLGPFGGHNFYAGYVKRAVIQLLITLLSCFSAAIVSWVWAIFEICLVTQDDDGIGFI
jgi:TM2 domain-containing membrane protein YozV